jgi:hypothetical protein
MPARIDSDGTQKWFKNGELHRDNGPAIIDSNVFNEVGTQYWFQNGFLHRDNGPAIIYSDGSQSWYKNGFLHKDNGPAIIYTDGKKEYYKNGIKDHCPLSDFFMFMCFCYFLYKMLT